jgi:fumarate reductase subunit C
LTYSCDVIGTLKTFVVSSIDKVAALANNDQARKRSDSPSMEFVENVVIVVVNVLSRQLIID